VTERMRDDELETTLRDIGARLDYPAPTAMAAAVGARLREPRRRSWRFALAPALVTAAIFAIVLVLLSPDARAAAGEFLHLRGIDIFPVPSVPATLPTPKIAFSGERVSLAEARARIRFEPRLPTAADLGEPDDVYVETVGTSDRLTLVYRQRPGIPVSAQAGVSALVVEVRGTIDELLLGKATGPGTVVTPVSVGGSRGYWLEGAPHLFFYRDTNGNPQQETLRLAGNTLVWEQGGVTLRLEAQISRDDALRLAASFR
jgi:hypothetical protein